MGVQVGNQCFSSQQEAENYLYSQVTPLLTETGVKSPVFDSNGWTYEGQVMHASLPECSQVQNFKDGLIVGWALASVIIAAWGFVIIKRLL